MITRVFNTLLLLGFSIAQEMTCDKFNDMFIQFECENKEIVPKNTVISENVRKCYHCKCLGSYEGGEELALLFGEFLGDVLDNTREAELAGCLLKLE
jgi:hypothetical protein